VDITVLTDEAILDELGSRLRTERLNQNLTVAELVARSGVAPRTIQNVENGENYSLSTLLGILRALGLLHRIDALLPEPVLSPIELAKLSGKPRQRATGSRGRRDPDDTWQW